MNEGFAMTQTTYSKECYIFLYIDKYSTITRDVKIAELLEDYVKLVISYGGYNGSTGLLFPNRNKAKAFANHLNDQYLVMLRLNGKI